MSEDEEKTGPYADIDNRGVPLLETIITTLDRPRWKEKYGSDLETVRQTHIALTRSYYFMSKSAIKGTFVLLIGLLAIDFLIDLQSFIYGLSTNIWGTMFLVYPSLRGRYVISAIAEGVSEDAVRQLEISKMVSTNLGFAILAFGFVLQIFAHQIASSEFISTNYMEPIVPEWTVFLMIFLVFILASKGVSN